MRYQFLIDSYETERLKVVSVWSMCHDEGLFLRPHPEDRRGRNLLEHMIHQCVSEDLWFKNMLGIDVAAPPLPKQETRLEFVLQYAEDSGKRMVALRSQSEGWWEEEVRFFEVRRSRAWVMLRRIAHTSHHRGQQTTLLRMRNHELHSTYGPTADTGGLMQNKAPVIYPYPGLESLLKGESAGGQKAHLPGPGDKPSTERS